MRALPAPHRPRLIGAALRRAAAAVAARDVRARVTRHARRRGRAHAAVKAAACLDPPWGGPLAFGPTCRPLAWRVWLPRVDLAIVARIPLGFIFLQLVKSLEIQV